MGDWAAGQILPDIPRFYTALAEWLSCIFCMRETMRRYSEEMLNGLFFLLDTGINDIIVEFL